MSEPAKIYIANVGMISPVGFDAASTAAVRAGMSGYETTGFYLDEDDYIRMARVPQEALINSLPKAIDPEEFTARQIRLLQLATLALGQLQPTLPQDMKLPLFISGPEQLIDGDRPIDTGFLEMLTRQTGTNLDIASSRIISTGRAGGLAAIKLAFRLFASSDQNYVIIGGVDTFYDGQILQILLRDERLLAGGNMDGFVPGEGAAFILLSKSQIPLSHNSHRVVTLYEPGLASETGHRSSSEPYRGDGLAAAMATALDNAKTSKIKTLYSSMNGEHFFAKEHGVAMLRNSKMLEENMKIEHPADCFGDLGAAFGPVVTGLSGVHLLNNSSASPCIVCCSSDKEPRSAMVMHA